MLSLTEVVVMLMLSRTSYLMLELNTLVCFSFSKINKTKAELNYQSISDICSWETLSIQKSSVPFFLQKGIYVSYILLGS
ncbi:hypothetical protein GLYMA_11G195650v4 [Glycine max]|nr:hypothetical protein GLYMA_11G195650v4 [Glycine max]KAH1159415.1 hypothetical protein GYH30_031228 [Glycine max]